MEVPPPQLLLPSSSELGGASELRDASQLEGTHEPGGLDDIDSTQPISLPMLGREIHHRRRAVSPAAS